MNPITIWPIGINTTHLNVELASSHFLRNFALYINPIPVVKKNKKKKITVHSQEWAIDIAIAAKNKVETVEKNNDIFFDIIPLS